MFFRNYHFFVLFFRTVFPYIFSVSYFFAFAAVFFNDLIDFDAKNPVWLGDRASSRHTCCESLFFVHF